MTPTRIGFSSPPLEATTKIGDRTISGLLMSMGQGDSFVLSVPAATEIPLGSFDRRVLSPSVIDGILDAASDLEDTSAESWAELISKCDIDLTDDESNALFQACSSGAMPGALCSLPSWASVLIEELESDVPPTWIYVSDQCIALDQREFVEADHGGGEPTIEGQWTILSRGATLTSASFGVPVEFCIARDGDAVVAVLHEFDNGSCIVSEAGGVADEHYEADDVKRGEASTTFVRGRVVSYCCVSQNYSAVHAETESYGAFWLPASCLSQTAPSAQNDDAPGGGLFGQDGGNFYVDHQGERMHIATALKILQRHVDQVSHNRSERFRTMRRLEELGLVPLAHYALKREADHLRGIVFVVASLDKLVRVAQGSTVAHLDTAAVDAPNLQAQFTYFDVDGNGVYRRSRRQSGQMPLVNAPDLIITRVDLEHAEGANGGRLSTETLAQLGEISFVDEHQASQTRRVELVVCKKARGATRSTSRAPSLTQRCRLAARLDPACKLEPQGSVVSGDLLISIGDVRVEGGCAAARSAIRSAMARAEVLGGRVSLVFWRPPADWTPPVAGDGDEQDGRDGDAGAASEAAMAPPAPPREPELSETQMVSLARVTKRLDGGDSNSNLTRICAALGLTRTGGAMQRKRRIDAELRRRKFPAFTEWEPTHAEISSLFAGDADSFYAKYLGTVHSVAKAERMLTALATHASSH